MSSEHPQAQIRLTHFDASVYEPSDDSFTLVDALCAAAANWRSSSPEIVLEVGCGSGYIICSIASILKSLGHTALMLATDINANATAVTSGTLKAHQVAAVDILCAEFAKPLMHRLRHRVDLLVFNPPYVPTPLEEVQRQGIAQAWAGGPHGRVIIDQFLPLVAELLSDHGQLFLVTIAQNDPQGILQELRKYDLTGEVCATLHRAFPWQA
ncbi:hypothetical protein WJX73_009070 [Symbiochloris irregularis]|uniref:Methyltransferase small domain-containing protein n=1 Tax=Symbiochloris irregularis TaxID=706552 RepID=A0AAW1PCY6_9CHLO